MQVSESFSTRCQALHFVKLLCFSGLVREHCDIMKSKHFRKATYAICFTFGNYFFFCYAKFDYLIPLKIEMSVTNFCFIFAIFVHF